MLRTPLPLVLVLMILIVHFIADFMCQTNQMALNKSKSAKWLLYHVLVVTAFLGVLTVAFRFMGLAPGSSALLWPIVNGALHYATDHVTSRWTTRLWFLKTELAGKRWRVIDSNEGGGISREENAYWIDDTGTRHDFFVVIGLDQLLHMIVYMATAAMWLH